MINFRYHIVSIVSVFLALAIGVALGGGPLKGEVDNTLVQQVKSDRATKTSLVQQINGLTRSPTSSPRRSRRGCSATRCRGAP